MSNINSELNACMFKADCMKTHEDVNRFRDRITQLETELAAALASQAQQYHSEDALNMVQSQAQQESRWISVDERLPEVKVESFEFYLVTTLNLKTKKQSVSEAVFLNEMELYGDNHDPQLFSGWHSAKESKDYDGWYEPLGNEYCKVTHWMPLPPAPEGE